MVERTEVALTSAGSRRMALRLAGGINVDAPPLLSENALLSLSYAESLKRAPR